MKPFTEFVMDPTNTVICDAGYSAHMIKEECGILMTWAAHREPDQSIKEGLLSMYQYGVHEMTGGTIDEEGIYSYPEDPPLAPLLSISEQSTGEIVYVYPYGIVAFTHPDEDTYVTRMD